jgi:hypothetical protein
VGSVVTPGGTWAEADAAVRAEWLAGRTAEVVVGHRWEVLRIARPIGDHMLSLCCARGITLGPILETVPRAAMEIVVALGTAATWSALPATRCVCVGAGMIRCPAPSVTGRRIGGRRWIVPPDVRRPFHTDADALCELVTQAIATRALTGLSVVGLRDGRR